MGRPNRVDVGGYAQHVLNRAVGRRRIFQRAADFAAFEAVLAEAVAKGRPLGQRPLDSTTDQALRPGGRRMVSDTFSVPLALADWGVMSLIKPVKCKEGPPSGLYRSQMTDKRLEKLGYGRRWHAETFMSGMKRTMGSMLVATTGRGLMIDAATKVLAYAIRR